MKHTAPPPPEEFKEFAPLWITTFADLISQLFSFFVLLLVLASAQEAGMVGALRDSFVSSTKNFGLKGSFAGEFKNPGDYVKPKYSVKDPEETDERTLDAQASELQSLYKQITSSVQTSTSKLVGSQITYQPKDIHFKRGDSELSQADKELLQNDISSLKANLPERDVKIYVLGIAASESSDWSTWATSARRAQAVADYIKTQVPEQMGWHVYSWGAGKGGEWTSKEGQMAKEADIMVAVLRK